MQLKKAAYLSTMIGLKTKHADCLIAFKLNVIRGASREIINMSNNSRTVG